MPFDRRWLIFFYGFCINDTDLQSITKTEVVGLQKLKWLIFDCCRKTNHLRYIWTDPLYVGILQELLLEAPSIFKNVQFCSDCNPYRCKGSYLLKICFYSCLFVCLFVCLFICLFVIPFVFCFFFVLFCFVFNLFQDPDINRCTKYIHFGSWTGVRGEELL